MSIELRRRGGDASSSMLSPSLRSTCTSSGGAHSNGVVDTTPTPAGTPSHFAGSAAAAASAGGRVAAFGQDDHRRDNPMSTSTSLSYGAHSIRSAERQKRVAQLQQNHQRRLFSKQLYAKLRAVWGLLLLLVFLAYGCLRVAQQQQQQPYAPFAVQRGARDPDPGRPYSRRVAHFAYFDTADKRRIEGVEKIRRFHRQMNSTVDRLPPNAMTTDKFLRGLDNSRDYRHLGEPLETQDCEEQLPWQSQVRPTCNTLHEFADLTALEGGDDSDEVSAAAGAASTIRTTLVANGYWRDVWVVTDDHGVRVVKTLRYEHRLTLRNYDRNRRDAMSLEHLTSSRYVATSTHASPLAPGVVGTSHEKHFQVRGGHLRVL